MKNTRFVFLSACLGMLLFGISLITLGSVAAALQQKFDLTELTSGTLFSILPFGILLGSLIFGPFADRYGYKVILILSCICIFAGFQGIAFASTLGILQLSVFSFGFGGGAINGATNAAVADISAESKGANISLVGVFFAVGALGMPFILGIMEEEFSFSTILSAVGYLTLAIAVVFAVTIFPAPKHSDGIPFSRGLALLKDPVLLLIGFFLFCQSSFEAIINNWTTTFLTDKLSVSSSEALYALSLYVAGMAFMRLLVGGVWRKVSPQKILLISFALVLTGIALLAFTGSYGLSVAGLILTGAGLASGFPVMLGLVGDRYASLSGTAFSLVFTIALLGNMTINYLMGVVANLFGIAHLTTMAFSLLAVMTLLSFLIKTKIQGTLNK